MARETGGESARKDTAPSLLRKPLSKMLADLAKLEDTTVADLVDESPLPEWTLERYSKRIDELADRAAKAREEADRVRKRKGGR